MWRGFLSLVTRPFMPRGHTSSIAARLLPYLLLRIGRGRNDIVARRRVAPDLLESVIDFASLWISSPPPVFVLFNFLSLLIDFLFHSSTRPRMTASDVV